MLSFKKLEIILKEIEESNMFNVFFLNLFDYKKEEINKLIIRYFFDKGFIVDIFDYNNCYKYTRYKFNVNNDRKVIKDDNIITINIDLKNIYKNFNINNKFWLFSSLFMEKDTIKQNRNLKILFDEEIANIFLKYI